MKEFREFFEKTKLNFSHETKKVLSYARALREDIPSLKECAYMSAFAVPATISLVGITNKNWSLIITGAFAMAFFPEIILGIEDFLNKNNR